MNNLQQEIIISLSQVPAYAEQLIKVFESYAIVLLRGDIGAGKTTLMKAIMNAYGVSTEVVSPTFTYVVSYCLPNGKLVHHFDLYRIATLDQFLASGFDEYLNEPDSIVFIEWPEVIESLLQSYPKKYAIDIELYGIDNRTLITYHLG